MKSSEEVNLSFQSIFAINLSKSKSHEKSPIFDMTPIWNTVDDNKNDITDSNEIWRLRKECQSLVEENRRLQNLSIKNDPKNSLINELIPISGATTDKILQGQVENLQWQLKQMEFNRKMCNDVIMEVIRYLEKCQTSFNAWHQHLKKLNVLHNNDIVQQGEPIKFNQRIESTSPSCQDSTWRRVVKSNSFSKANHGCDYLTNPLKDYFNKLSTGLAFEDGTQMSIERLSKESFRLLRTIENFISTQEQSIPKPKPSSIIASLGSTSSKDPDLEYLYNVNSEIKHRKKKSGFLLYQQTENDLNESGFSSMNSMNSFHENGLPLNLSLTDQKVTKPSFDTFLPSLEYIDQITKVNVLWV